MLGPSILFASPPFCTGYAVHAFRHARARTAAGVGLALAVVELFLLAALSIIGLFTN